MIPRPPTSAVGSVITRYLALTTALGRAYAIERHVRQTPDAFLPTAEGCTADLTPEMFTRWATRSSA